MVLQAEAACLSATMRGDPKFLFDRVQRYYSERLDQTWNFVHPMKGATPGPGSIKMRSNDYLCLARHPHVIQAKLAALADYGHGESVSRIWQHHESDLLQTFEERVARLLKAGGAVLCNSGYCANVGLIQAVATSETPVYIDMKAHASLWEGIKSAGAIAVPFRHNDPGHLERLVAKSGPGFVVVDAVYSIDGNVCDLHNIIAVAEQYGCATIVDETHSFGTHGPDGAGLVVAEGLAERVHFRTVGLSKAVSGRGGIVVCSARNAEFLRYESLPTIFSTSVLEYEAAGFHAVLDVFANEPWRQRKVHQNHERLRQALTDLGYNVELSRSQIIALEAGEILQTVKLRDALETRGVFGALFFPPATPEKRCLIRFTVNSGLTTSELDRVIAVCREIREEVDLAKWPSTRRLQRPGKVREQKKLAA